MINSIKIGRFDDNVSKWQSLSYPPITIRTRIKNARGKKKKKRKKKLYENYRRTENTRKLYYFKNSHKKYTYTHTKNATTLTHYLCGIFGMAITKAINFKRAADVWFSLQPRLHWNFIGFFFFGHWFIQNENLLIFLCIDFYEIFLFYWYAHQRQW